jgi:cytochrome c oxidase subunit 4
LWVRKTLAVVSAGISGAECVVIATVKATLVVLFFMHVKGASERLTGVVVVAGFFFLAILLSLSKADYLTRAWR